MDGERNAAPRAGDCVFDPLAECDPVEQSGQAVVMRHVLDLGLGDLALGDVFVRRDPAAALHALDGQRNRPPVGQLDRPRSLRRVQQQVRDEPIRIAAEGSGFRPHLKQALRCCARLERVRRKTVHFRILPVRDDQPVVRVEHQQALTHVVDRGVKLNALFAHLPVGGDVCHIEPAHLERIPAEDLERFRHSADLVTAVLFADFDREIARGEYAHRRVKPRERPRDRKARDDREPEPRGHARHDQRDAHRGRICDR